MSQPGDYREQPGPGRGPGYTSAAGFGPQGEHPSARPAKVPPQFAESAPPRQERIRPAQPPYQPPQPQQPAFTPGWPQNPQPPRGQYPPPQPAWPQQQPYPPQQQYAPQPQRRRHTGRNVFASIAGGIVLIIGIAVAANSGGHTVQTAGSPAGAAAQGKAAPKTAGIGSAITLSGDGSGEQMAVTVTKVLSGAQAADEFSSAPAGDRLYAVQFRLSDTGSAAYSDSPSNGATVVDSAGQPYQSGLDNVAGCESFGGTENIASGSSGLGCIVFEVPKSAKITEVQFTLDSGMGPQTGQWDVG